LIVSQVHKFFYINSKLTVQNTVDYWIGEAFWKIYLCADRLGPSGGPSATPRWVSDRNYANHTFTLRSVRSRREHCPWPSSDRSISGANCPLIEKSEKTEGDGFGKNAFLASSRTVRGARIQNTLNAFFYRETQFG
jgi:hypothetical protein